MEECKICNLYNLEETIAKRFIRKCYISMGSFT